MVEFHPTAEVSADAFVAETASVWQFAHVREGAVIGDQTIVGRGVYIGVGVMVGARCKLQNYCLIYEPAVVGHGVFIGPSVVLTNDRHPRAINIDGAAKSVTDWVPVGVNVHDGASIGAGSVCIAPLTIGRWAMVAAGSVVTKDVPDFALVAGQPARQIGWVGPAGERLQPLDDQSFICPRTGVRFHVDRDGSLVEVA